jgi:hypothetical protein
MADHETSLIWNENNADPGVAAVCEDEDCDWSSPWCYARDHTEYEQTQAALEEEPPPHSAIAAEWGTEHTYVHSEGAV